MCVPCQSNKECIVDTGRFIEIRINKRKNNIMKRETDTSRALEHVWNQDNGL